MIKVIKEKIDYVNQQQRNTYDMPCSQHKEEETRTHNNGLPWPLHINCTTVTQNTTGDENWN